MTKLWAYPTRKHLQTTYQNVARMAITLLNMVENIVGKEENAGHQHFLLFPQCFQKPSPSRSLELEILW